LPPPSAIICPHFCHCQPTIARTHALAYKHVYILTHIIDANRILHTHTHRLACAASRSSYNIYYYCECVMSRVYTRRVYRIPLYKLYRNTLVFSPDFFFTSISSIRRALLRRSLFSRLAIVVVVVVVVVVVIYNALAGTSYHIYIYIFVCVSRTLQ